MIKHITTDTTYRLGLNRAGRPKYDEAGVEDLVAEITSLEGGNALTITTLCRKAPDLRWWVKEHRVRKFADNDGGPRWSVYLRLEGQYTDQFGYSYSSEVEAKRQARRLRRLLDSMGCLAPSLDAPPSPGVTVDQVRAAFALAGVTPVESPDCVFKGSHRVDDHRIMVGVQGQPDGEWSIYYTVERSDDEWGWIQIVTESDVMTSALEIRQAFRLI